MPIKIKFKPNPNGKSYLTTINNIKKLYAINEIIENKTIYNVVETTVDDCQSSSVLSYSLKYTRNTQVVYRGEEYPYSEFKSAIYKYRVNEIETIEEHFNKAIKLEKNNPILTRNKTYNYEPINTTIYDFVAIDFETSNRRHSICSVGLVAVKDNEIVDEKHWYICPCSSVFENWNVNKHGITYEKVKYEPSFIEVWQDLQYYVIGQKLVAHNAASTDITCLRKAFEEYNIKPSPSLNNYDCTLQLSRVLLPQLENHQLPTVVNHFGIETFKHHDALEDARVCAKVYLELKKIESKTNIYSEYQKKKKDKVVPFYKENQPKANLENISFWKSMILSNDFLSGKNVVVTGEFLERDLVESKLKITGAKIRDGVNGKTDIVIIGNNPGWRKLAVAKELISKGQDIKFIEASEIVKLLYLK